MKRADLLDKVETVAPALANNDILPVMKHLWFTGDDVMAYNGHVAISVPCRTEFVGAVPGILFINMLKALSSKEIEFEDDGKTLHLRGGSSRVKLGTLGKRDFVSMFTMPPGPKEALGCDADKFLAAIDLCVRSLSIDTSVPDQLGITLIPGKRHMAFYATNGSTLSRGEVSLKGDSPWPRRAILPALFCKQLLSFVPKHDKLRLSVNEKFAMYARPDGLRMVGNLVESEKPLSFGDTFDELHPAVSDDRLYPIAEKMANVIERACIISSSETKAVQMRVTVAKGKATFNTKTPLHGITDTMDMPSKQPDVALMVDPKWIKVGLDAFSRMLLTPRCFIMESKAGFYLVSAKGD